jgi:DNA-binding LacI/PurR family transcriptional regulator
MNKGRQRTTISDVAREAGVSRATVGFVLSNDPHQTISPATREKVRQAAQRLGYQSFAPARLLRTGRSSIVLLVIQTIHIAPIYAYVVEPLAKTLSTHGFNLLWQIGISSDPEQPHPASDLVPAVVVSLIEEPDEASETFLRRFGAPVVYAISSSFSNRQASARLQATYLFEKGHRQLAVAASHQSAYQEAHLEAIRQTCSEYGVEPPVAFTVPERRSAVRAVLTTLLSEHPSLTAICATDDEIALAILAALADLNIPVPDRIAVIGNGNLSLASRSVPALTTVSADDPASYIEKLIANILAASRGEPLSDPEPVSYHVVVRKST